MEINYCQVCGEKLIPKEIGDEGMIPFCETCQKPYFKSPAPCVLVFVLNEYNEVVLLQQGYLSNTYWGLVAGYITEGENAEDTVIREVKEETGLEVKSFKYIASYHQPQKNLLMLGYLARAEKAEFVKSSEVDQVDWFSIKDAVLKLREGSIGKRLFDAVVNQFEDLY